MAHPEAPQPADLHVFDLCVLAYQIYNQSLIWPLDPFFEEWARPGARRRDNVMRSVRESLPAGVELRGPGTCRNWSANEDLDPVLTDYRRVDPTRPVITNDGVKHRLMRTHRSITDRFSHSVVCEYRAERSGRPVDPYFSTRMHLHHAGNGTLYSFEGGTGSFDGKPEAWSLLGIVADCEAEAGYEVEIAFRGSQSGNGHRAAYQGFVTEAGNPDWVTDMEFLKTVSDHRISATGRVTLGLRDSVLSCLGTILHCLEDIAQRRGGPPRTVHITGHSLGGALAVQLASAFSVGSIRQTLSVALRSWPWDSLQLTTFGAQKSGDAEFAQALSERVRTRRIWLEGDPIPQFPLHEHVGSPIPLSNGRSGTENHEPAVIRRALVDELNWHNRSVDPSIASFQPWRHFDDVGSALAVAAVMGFEPSDLFPHNEPHDRLLVDVAASAVANATSYRVPWTKPLPERARRSKRLRALMAQSAGSVEDLERTVPTIRGVQPGSAELFLRRWFVLREASRHHIPTAALLGSHVVANALGTYERPPASDDDGAAVVARAAGPPPDRSDLWKVRAILAMRQVHRRTVDRGSEDDYRRRVPPVSGAPQVVRACSHYPGLEWLPKELMVPTRIPPEGQLPLLYTTRYYALGKLGFTAYSKSPVRPQVPWRADNAWKTAFDPPEDGWSDPTDDETFVRLRLQGPNPFDLRRSEDGYVLDFADLFEGVLPRIAAHFDLDQGQLRPRHIEVGRYTHRPTDETWERAKRLVNAADIRVVPFLRHLLEVHFIVGQSFALGAYHLPTWHPLRPFMQFFSYGTLQVNDYAYRAFFGSSSYFMASGFMTGRAAAALFNNRMSSFNFDSWNPLKDVKDRGLSDIDGHPYVEDSHLAWDLFTGAIRRYLDALALDDQAIRDDDHLDIWYRTLGTLIPNFDARSQTLDRDRLVEVLSSFLYNNVVHEVCGDLSPLIRSDDPDDKAIINLPALAEAVGDGRLNHPIPAPSMNDVFLIDQASDASRFNVGGNNMLTLTAERWIDEPRLSAAIRDLQRSLQRLDRELDRRNDKRAVRFGRMQPRNWEASISF